MLLSSKRLPFPPLLHSIHKKTSRIVLCRVCETAAPLRFLLANTFYNPVPVDTFNLPLFFFWVKHFFSVCLTYENIYHFAPKIQVLITKHWTFLRCYFYPYVLTPSYWTFHKLHVIGETIYLALAMGCPPVRCLSSQVPKVPLEQLAVSQVLLCLSQETYDFLCSNLEMMGLPSPTENGYPTFYFSNLLACPLYHPIYDKITIRLSS